MTGTNVQNSNVQETGKYFRIIRYVQIENWGTPKYSPFSHFVGLSAIEFFGSITSFERKQ